MKITKGNLRKSFWKYGCSGALCYVMDREFGHPKENEEKATGPLCGGFMQSGNQCGMLWGASLGAGAEAFRRNSDPDQAIGVAINTTQLILQSYTDRFKSPNCREVTGCDPGTIPGLLKYFILGKPVTCMNMGVRWAPEALTAAEEGLDGTPNRCKSCAAEVAMKMGADEEEIVMVSGFAGGLGLSGNVCGALAAAAWLRTLREIQRGKSIMSNPAAKNLLHAFKAETNGKLRCDEITGEKFNSSAEHTEFISKGGCSGLIDLLADH